MGSSYTVRLLGALAIGGWILCAALGWDEASGQIEVSTIPHLLALLIAGFAVSMPFLVVIGFKISDRD